MKKLLLLLTILTAVACQKDERNFPDYLIGSWQSVNSIRNGYHSTCDVKFSKLTDDKLKMEVLTGYYTGDKYTINVDGNGVNLHVYTQSIYVNSDQIMVTGSGYAKNGGFRLDLNRTEDNQTEQVHFYEY
jgi:hypothetical protein